MSIEEGQACSNGLPTCTARDRVGAGRGEGLQHNYIGTEHLLLGLIREGEGVAAKALASKGVELDATRKQVEE